MDIIKKLLETHVLTGIVLGVLIGMYFPLEAYKPVLVFLGLVMSVVLVSKAH